MRPTLGTCLDKEAIHDHKGESMRRTIAVFAVATAFVGAVPATSAAEDSSLSSPVPGCFDFGADVANAVRFGYVEPERTFGATVSNYAHTYDGNPLRFDRYECTGGSQYGGPGHPFDDPRNP
jgi:hypothetical protein